MTRARVVVTGVGVLSPGGIGIASFQAALLEGRECPGDPSVLDGSPFAGRLARGVAGFEPKAILGSKGLRYLNRATLLACAAARLALEDAGLPLDDVARSEIGVALGTTFGNFHNDCEFDRTSETKGHRFLNPMDFPNTVVSTPASYVSMMLGVTRFNSTVSSEETAGLDALILAVRYLRVGRGTMALAGGVDDLSSESYARLSRMGRLVPADGRPEISAPFDRRRSGYIAGEGGAFLFLEELEHARRRGARIYAEIKGVGSGFDPGRHGFFLQGEEAFRSGPETSTRVLRAALRDAGVGTDEIDYVSAGANSSPTGDRMEAHAIRALFDRNCPAVSSVKGTFGEASGASGAFQAIAAALGLRGGWVPPTAGYREADPECGLDTVVADAPLHLRVRNALVHAYDASGIDSAMVLGAA